ncbi:hypothetical protein BGZ92_005346, partial [Podila epicladia]
MQLHHLLALCILSRFAAAAPIPGPGGSASTAVDSLVATVQNAITGVEATVTNVTGGL